MDQPTERASARRKGISRRTQAEPEGPRMTMRVYRVSPETGEVTQELGKVIVMVKDKLAPLQSSQFPPCECPLHRDRSAPWFR
ncbi:hypothetical protein ABT174_21950 [Streptomyces sparsogenes]|uniref:hypothetical protein n=1 Tax=Streptomyces sparsogenes TaxID=67365 RepID=UPI00332DF70E